MMKKIILLVVSHIAVAVIGFGAGIYALPILTAPTAPAATEVRAAAQGAQYTAQFRRDLKDSDALHWGEGSVSIGRRAIALDGKIAPGPDYRLYLSPKFVETEADFAVLKPQMAQVGAVKTFENFIVAVPDSIDPSAFNTVVIWCESFGEFITAAQYQ